MKDTIIDYIKKTKDETFEERPFCEVDSLILCQFSYLKFDGMVPGIGNRDGAVSLQDIYENNYYEKLYADERYMKNNRALFEAMLESSRFNTIRLHSYINIIDYELETQFAAITIELSSGTTFVAFRGTDENLVGWKEDLNLALSAPIPGQLRSVDYLESVSKYISERFMIGGHSKGGNLAMFSAMYCSDAVRDRITHIFNHDGPGFRPEVFDDSTYEEIKDRIFTSVPQSSLVGMFLSNDDNYEVIESKMPILGIMQHDPYSWKVKNNAFVRADGVKDIAFLRGKSINEWVLGLDQEKIRFFVDETYEIMLATGENNLNGIMKNWQSVISNVRAAMKDMDEESKEMLSTILEALSRTGEINAKAEINSKIEDIKQYRDDIAEQAKEMTEQAKAMQPVIAEKITQLLPDKKSDGEVKEKKNKKTKKVKKNV